MATFEAGWAEEADDANLRRLLRENPMEGRISLSFEREPDFFLGGTVEGERHGTMVVRESATGRVVSMGSLSRYEAFVNGEKRWIGYLSQLRLARELRANVGVLARGFSFFRRIAADFDVDFFVTTIIADNAIGKRFLATDKRGFPAYREAGRLFSLVLPLWDGFDAPSELAITRGEDSDLDEIAAFLMERLEPFQFAPVWRPETLRSPTRSRGLAARDFLVARRGGRVVACLALWDQTSFRQSVVRGYDPWLRLARPLVNLVAPWTGTIRLPPVGRSFRYFSLSHAAAVDAESFVSLVCAACREARTAGQSYVTFGLCEGHPFLPAVRAAFRLFEYESTLYTVHWPEQTAGAARVDRSRAPHLEIATL